MQIKLANLLRRLARMLDPERNEIAAAWRDGYDAAHEDYSLYDREPYQTRNPYR